MGDATMDKVTVTYTMQIANYTTKLSQSDRIHDFEYRPMNNPLWSAHVDALTPTSRLEI